MHTIIKAYLVRSRGGEHSSAEQADIIHKRPTTVACEIEFYWDNGAHEHSG